MALERVKLKRGMGGSNSGKGRTAGTETYKRQSKKQRRKEGQKEIKKQQNDA